jgi:hypothetical protein
VADSRESAPGRKFCNGDPTFCADGADRPNNKQLGVMDRAGKREISKPKRTSLSGQIWVGAVSTVVEFDGVKSCLAIAVNAISRRFQNVSLHNLLPEMLSASRD